MDSLYQDLMMQQRQLSKAVRLSRELGAIRAEAERDYKIVLRQECLKLKAEGMAVGMIDKICYGVPAVAEARYKRDIAESDLFSNREVINACKINMRIIEGQISREWGVIK